MRTISVVLAVLVLGASFGMISGSGVDEAVFGIQTETVDPGTEQQLEQTGDEASTGDGIESSVAGDNEPTVTGIAIGAGQFAISAVAAVALVPATLMRLGFPSFFAIPVGALAQIVAFVGVFQFITGREWL